ncbi:MAG: hypothetical protein P0S93_04590 [Candidatus Neptunochlamydia sp.]|nr:hypothetical protein [Candidatus Neptunochlamydia sp.]
MPKMGGNCQFIMVQLPEVCDKKSEAFKIRYQTIAEISKERIRRAGKKIQEEHPDYQGDLGFKVFKLDSTNIKPWEVDDDLDQAQLEAFIDPIKPNRTDDIDLVYEVLLKYGFDLTLPIEEHIFDGEKFFNIGEGALIICLSNKISLEVVSKILELKNAERNVERVVFKDSGFESDAVKINAIQMLKTVGIEEVKSI